MITIILVAMTILIAQKRMTIISPTFWSSWETNNVVIITILSLTLSETMLFKDFSKEEKASMFTIRLVGILVSLAFYSKSPLKFLICIEAAIYPLAWNIIQFSKDEDKVQSLKIIVLINTAITLPFMVFFCLREPSSLWFYNLQEIKSSTIRTLTVMILAIKTPIFLVHFWLTKAHVSASGNCSMILARIIIKLGTLGIYKFFVSCRLKIFSLTYSLALTRVLALNIMIIRYLDSKTLVAISSILHIAIIIPIVISKKYVSMASSIIIISAHGLISYFLFYTITLTYENLENRRILFVKSLESSIKIMAIIILLYLFLNIGLPPLINFYSETIFLALALHQNSIAITVYFRVSIILAVIFTIQIASNLLFNKKSEIIKGGGTPKISGNFFFYTYWILALLWLIY